MNPDEQHHGNLESSLCPRCKNIDLQDFFSGTSAGTDRIFHVFEPPHHLRQPECALCSAIAFIRPDLSENDVYHLVQVQPDRRSPGNRLTVWQPGDSEARHWTPHTENNESSLPGGLGFASNLHPCEQATLGLPRKIYFEVVKRWMNECKEDHGESCKTEPTGNIPNLRLIDCATREIRLYREGDIYAALSYCLGASQANPADGMGTPFRLPQPLPATIEDAILATQKLGIKYLWIDRYCVSQSVEDPGRHEQISLMHKIYIGADVTLIAAAGDSPTHGLPGVTKERGKLPEVNLGSHSLVVTLPDPCLLIASSKWSTRGWTYQEALLSRRRLVFTDQQLYFQCNKALPRNNIYEGHTYIGRSEAVSLSSTRIDSCNITEDIDGFFKFGFGHYDIWSRINEYTQRSLSRQEDIVNALLGILEKYAETKWAGLTFWHLSGVPLYSLDGWKDINSDSSRNPLFINLAWELPVPSKRREGFPSWSWAGWEGTGFVGPYDYPWPLMWGDREFADVYVEQEDSMRAADMDQIIQRRAEIAPHWKIPRIIFGSLFVPLTIKRLSQCPPSIHETRYLPLENELDLRVVMQSGGTVHSYNFQLLPRDLVDDPGLDEGITCVGLLLDPPMHPGASIRIDAEIWERRGVVVLLLVESHPGTRPKTEKLYERVGKTVIPKEHLERVSNKYGHFTVA